MCLGVNLCVGLLLASTAATASAAVRYATPTGVGAEPCGAGTPCSLGDAVSGAAGGDQVLLAGGTYTLASTLNVNAPISIEGPPQGTGARLITSGLNNDAAVIGASNVTVSSAIRAS